MPLHKRVLFDAPAYHRPDAFMDIESRGQHRSELLQFNSSSELAAAVVLQDNSMSRYLGAVNQLSYLSSYAFELFQNLAMLSEDLSERVKIASIRTAALQKQQLRSVEKAIGSVVVQQHALAPIAGIAKYLLSREMVTPPMFTKPTNYPSVQQLYSICRPPPQLWRIEVYLPGGSADCFRLYSFPGFFFQEWLRSEIRRQEINRLDRKRAKAEKKKLKLERRKKREEALETLQNLQQEHGDYDYGFDGEEDTIAPGPKQSVLAAATAGNGSAGGGRKLRHDNENRSSLLSKPNAADTAPTAEAMIRESASDLRDTEASLQRSSANADADDAAGNAAVLDKENPEVSQAVGKKKSAHLGGGLSKLFNMKQKQKHKTEKLQAAGAAVVNSKPVDTREDDINSSMKAAEGVETIPSKAGTFIATATTPTTNRIIPHSARNNRRSVSVADAASLQLLTGGADESKAPNTTRGIVSTTEQRESSESDARAFRVSESNSATRLSNSHPTTSAVTASIVRDEEDVGAALPFDLQNLSLMMPTVRRRGAANSRPPVASMRIGGRIISAESATAKPESSSSQALRPRTNIPTATDAVKGTAESAPSQLLLMGDSAAAKRTQKRMSLALQRTAALDTETSTAINSGDNRHKSLLHKLQAEVQQQEQQQQLHESSSSAVDRAAKLGTAEDSRPRLLSDLDEEEDFEADEGTAAAAAAVGRLSTGDSLHGADDGRIDVEGEEDVDIEELDYDEDAIEDAEDEEALDFLEELSEPEDPPSDDSQQMFDDNATAAASEIGGAAAASVSTKRSQRSNGDSSARLGGARSAADDSDSRDSDSAYGTGAVVRKSESSKRSAAAPPPPPPPPPPPKVQSALSQSVLAGIKGTGLTQLRKVQPVEKKVDVRTQMLQSIQTGTKQLKSAANRPLSTKVPEVKQNEAVAAILANRAMIAGDSDSSDSESDYTDDDYG